MKKKLLAFALVFTVAPWAFAQEAERPGTIVPDGPPVQAEPQPPKPSIEERVTFLLSGYEYFPTRADLDAVAKPDVMVPLLVALARDADKRNTLRLRAVDALGYYDDEASGELLLELARVEPDELPRKKRRIAVLLKHHAITSLARARKEAAVEDLAPLLKDEDVQIRITVVNAFGKHGGASGKAKLADLVTHESHGAVKRELNKWVQ